MIPWLALSALSVIIIGVMIFLCRGIQDIPDSGRSMDGPYYAPRFERKD